MNEPSVQKAPGAWVFDAVVIGASSGGIEVLGALLPRLPANFPAAVLVVQHIRGDSRSLLHEIFAPQCAMTLCEAADKQPIEAGTVYFAPPDYHLLVEPDRTCVLSVDDPVRYSRPSIDVLFESAAWVYRSRLLGILLTGANDDGSAGMAAIRAAGGTTWAQLPSSAHAPAMPLGAIALGAVDEVLAPEAIALRLAMSAPAGARAAATGEVPGSGLKDGPGSEPGSGLESGREGGPESARRRAGSPGFKPSKESS